MAILPPSLSTASHALCAHCSVKDGAASAVPLWAGGGQQQSAAPKHFRLTTLLCVLLASAALVALAGADEASEDEVEASSEESGEIGASEHAKTVTLFPDFPDKSAFPPHLPLLPVLVPLTDLHACAD